METLEFLEHVITAESGYFCLAFGTGQAWKEEWYKWPEEKLIIVERAKEEAKTSNVYFSSYLFAQASSTKINVLPSLTIQADLDGADITTLPIVPTIVVESSPERYQAYWILRTGVDTDAHEILSRKLTYSIPLCDRSGWPLGRKLRVPGTINHKYLDGPKEVLVIGYSGKTYNPADLELLPDADPHAEADFDWLESEIEIPEIGPQELLESVKSLIPAKVYTQYNNRAKDRSAALWSLMCSAFRANLSREQVFWLAKNSANNKFQELTYRADRELAKDVLRAEATVKYKNTNIRETLVDARKLKGIAYEKRSHMLNLILAAMKSEGEFIRTTDDNIWYIRSDLGRPILITQRSEYLDMILDLQYGINSTEAEHNFIVAGLSSYARSLTSTAIMSSLAYYDQQLNHLLIHTGKKEVLRITPCAIDRTVDGSYDVVFPWSVTGEHFNPDFSDLETPWYELVFGNGLNNIIGLPKDEALALLRTWFMFLLFRSLAVSRPILALFGQPGSGKSTLFRKLYVLLYGRTRSIGAVTNSDDFDHSVSVDPLVVLDNVDTWEKWLPDRLALSASTSDITKRKLYTDSDTVVLKRQALVGITAHNPRFSREDVTDRMLLLSFERFPHFIPEGQILEDIYKYRNRIWGAIAKDAQKVLATSMAVCGEAPQFRVEDFARVGYWIACALGYEDTFCEGITKIRTSQKVFNLDEEQLLVNALYSLVQRQKEVEWRSAGKLWSDLELMSKDSLAFTKTYRNAVHLGKKLWAMQESLKEVFDIRWKMDASKGSRIWMITSKTTDREFINA